MSHTRLVYDNCSSIPQSANQSSRAISKKRLDTKNNKKLCYCRATAWCKSNLQTHLWSLAITPFDRPYTISY